MGTKSNRSSGSQHNPRGVTQGVTLVDPKSGNPIDTVLDSDGVKRLAVDANFTAQNVQVNAELEYDEDSVAIGDPITGNLLKINNDRSIDANVEVDAADGDNIAISDGTNTLQVNNDGSININNRDQNGNAYTVWNPLRVALDVEDSFGRLKTAQPHILFDATFQHSQQNEVFMYDSTLGASTVHDPLRAAMRLSCSSTNNSRARMRTRNYFPYSPSFTNTLIASFNFKGIYANIRKRFGLYDDQNGYFLETDGGGTVRFVIRSSIGGTTSDNGVNKSSWNIDKFDGTGPSGITLDMNKQQILFIQYQWLGSGSVIFGFVVDGKILKAHVFNHANIIDSLYSQTGTLPLSGEIINNGSLVASSMEITCCSLVANGATSLHGHLHSISSGAVPRSIPVSGTSIPVISLRKSAAHVTIPVQVLDMGIFSTSQDDFLVQVINRPTLTGAVWTPVPNSLCERDVSATSHTGGTIVAEFYLKGNLQASATLEQLAKFWDLTLGNDFNGNSDIISLVVTSLTTNSTVYGIISYKEFE